MLFLHNAVKSYMHSNPKLFELLAPKLSLLVNCSFLRLLCFHLQVWVVSTVVSCLGWNSACVCVHTHEGEGRDLGDEAWRD